MGLAGQDGFVLVLIFWRSGKKAKTEKNRSFVWDRLEYRKRRAYLLNYLKSVKLSSFSPLLATFKSISDSVKKMIILEIQVVVKTAATAALSQT